MKRYKRLFERHSFTRKDLERIQTRLKEFSDPSDIEAEAKRIIEDDFGLNPEKIETGWKQEYSQGTKSFQVTYDGQFLAAPITRW